MPLDERLERWCEYFETHQKEDLAETIQTGSPSVTLDFQQLRRAKGDMADFLAEKPQKAIRHIEEALQYCEVPHSDELEGVKVRVTRHPDREYALSEIREELQGTLITVRAQVSKATEVRPRIEVAAFECQGCYNVMKVHAVGDEVEAPPECDGEGCTGFHPIEINKDKSTMRDHQIIELQPRPDEDAMNLQRSLPMHLWDEQVDSVEAGDRVKATGILKTEEIKPGEKVQARRPQFLDGLSIDKEQQDFDSFDTTRVDEIKELSKRDDLQQALIDSFAEDILTGERGDTHKLAILYQLFGGVRHELNNGDEKRGDINILLIGAPGTGKSAYLNAANTLAPKSIKASGKGATAAGLTATATQPEFGDGWMLDAGALVMASGGLACIDEFDKMEDSARKSMHEAMEDQEIPINKAGINTTLTSKTAVLAAANPEGGSFDRFEPLSQQINLGEALITRFDLVFGVDDRPDADKDREIAKHQYNVAEDGKVQPAIEPDLLREYIAYARQNVDPSFKNQEAVDMLVDKYVDTRQDNGEDENATVPVTARMNESLRRIAEAAARSELSEVVKPKHATEAIELYEMTIGDIGLTQDGELDAAKAAGHESVSQQEVTERVRDWVDRHEGTTIAEPDIAAAVEAKQSKVKKALKRAAKSNLCTTDGHNEAQETVWRIY